jgi:hypothetical protein
VGATLNLFASWQATCKGFGGNQKISNKNPNIRKESEERLNIQTFNTSFFTAKEYINIPTIIEK